MNYKTVAKCFCGIALGSAFALANLHRLPEDVRKPLIEDAHKTITFANRDMMELSIQALQLRNEGVGPQNRVSDPAFCEGAFRYIARAEDDIIHLNDIVIAGTTQLWIWNREKYSLKDQAGDRAHIEDAGSRVQEHLNEVKDGCRRKGHGPTPTP